MVEISIIVPLYNVEKYLRRCVDSILVQTFQDFELILVDDGSTDASGRICDEYAGRYDRISVIHKGNEGVSEARNRGIDESRGEYLVFIDSDDYVDRQYLEVLYWLIKKYRADLVICDNIEVWGGKEAGTVSDRGKGRREQVEVISRAETYRRMFLLEHMGMSAWAKLYHRSLFQKARYQKGEIYEDVRILDQIIENSHKIVCTRYRGYYHVRRRGSLLHAGMTPEQQIRMETIKRLRDFILQKYPEIQDSAKILYYNNAIQMINLMVLDPERHYEKQSRILRKEVLRDCFFFLFHKGTKLEEKGALLCLVPGIAFYRFTWGIYLHLTGKDSGTMM